MAIVEASRTTAVTGGVGTHLELNVAAALDSIGGLLGVEEFPTTAAGHEKSLCWVLVSERSLGWEWKAPGPMGPAWAAT